MWFLIKCFDLGKDVFSPEVESSPAPSSTEPQNIPTGVKQTSRTSSFEIENLLKTAEQVNYNGANTFIARFFFCFLFICLMNAKYGMFDDDCKIFELYKNVTN